VVGLVLEVLTWQIILYAVLSLTLVRMLPVCLALRGSGLDLRSKLFVGWFGPRGLASIVFAVIVIAEPLEHTATLGATVACTVLLSVIAHGLSANPLVRSFGRYRRRQRAVSDSSCR
jgi:NhaP-type Na+/H+ or K+/H+ antiporter